MGRWAVFAALLGVGLAVMTDGKTARAEVTSRVARPAACTLPAAPLPPPRKVTPADYATARNEMERIGVAGAEVALRIKVIENVADTAVVFGDLRDGKYWKYVDDAYLPVGKASTSIRALWARRADGKPVCENGIRCFKYSKLILLKAHLDLASPKGVGILDKYLHGLVIPNDLPHSGDGSLYASEYKESGFTTRELRPGDQIYIHNPYYAKLTPAQLAADDRRIEAEDPNDKPRYVGEQGSNLIYIGGGNVMGIYSGEVVALEAYKLRMATQWWSPYDYHLHAAGALRPTPDDFLVTKVNRPLVDFVETAKAEVERPGGPRLPASLSEAREARANALKKQLEAEVGRQF